MHYRAAALCGDEGQSADLYRDDREHDDFRGKRYLDRGKAMKKEKGTVADLMAAGLCMLAMTMVILSYMGNARLIGQKEQVSQIARKYILRMETQGVLTDADRISLIMELELAGVTDLRLDGTTMAPVGYGEQVVLMIQGKLEDEYEFEEKKVSTAKH